MRLVSIAGLVLLASSALPGQPVFDVASIKASPASFKPDDAGHVEITPGGVSLTGVTLRACVKWAYGVRDDQVLGPAWTGTERYDIAAKAGAPTPVPELRLMLRTLLADRFGLTLHHETREHPVFVLLVGGNGPKLTPSPAAGPGKLKIVDSSLLFQHYTLAEFAERLSVTLGRPVLDRTGIAGVFDISVSIASGVGEMKLAAERARLANEPEDASRYLAALRQAGLKLESEKAPVEVLVIDHAERAPKAN